MHFKLGLAFSHDPFEVQQKGQCAERGGLIRVYGLNTRLKQNPKD
jgi:hypothetical protein